jgi:aryl-alcohol dehydrogenase-like predicted oxidoreductase
MARAYGIGLNAWMPLASGLLTGAYRKDRAFPPGSRFADPEFRAAYGYRLNDRVYAVVERVCALAEARGCTPAQLAMAWVSQAPGITSTILGPESIEDLDGALASLNVVVSSEERAQLDDVIAPGEHISSFYEWAPNGLLGE